MASVPNNIRDRLITEFRYYLCARLGITPLPHQADWWTATDGYDLTSIVADPLDQNKPTIDVRINDTIESRVLLPRRDGRAKVVGLLGAYKCGKSFSAGLWGASFAAVPDARVYLVGNIYDMCAPEFEYILEALISDRGLGIKPRSLQNRPKDGRMWLELQNGARIEARSWENRESLKGKEVDAYIYCEAYQLPGIECFTSVRQNLTARDGYAIFPTTPDRPWVNTIHKNGHGAEKGWVCKCGVPRSANPSVFSQADADSDRKLLTREKYAIAYEGKLGDYVGRVYQYQLGDRQFNLQSHPHLWHNPRGEAVPTNLKIPDDYRIVIGADTGTFMAAVIVAFAPDGTAFILDELANFTYIGDTPEIDPTLSVKGWCDKFKHKAAAWGGRYAAWVDSNSQFKNELAHHGIGLIPNSRGREVRTEASREYFQHNKVFLAPWLDLLPYELESARWPESPTASGRMERLKENDHVLDGMEHVFSRHPRGKASIVERPESPGLTPPNPARRRRRITSRYIDPHLGGQ